MGDAIMAIFPVEISPGSAAYQRLLDTSAADLVFVLPENRTNASLSGPSKTQSSRSELVLA